MLDSHSPARAKQPQPLCPSNPETDFIFSDSDLLRAPGFRPAPTLQELLERDKRNSEAEQPSSPLALQRNILLEEAIGNETQRDLKSAYLKAYNVPYEKERLTKEDGLLLLTKGNLLILGGLATRAKEKHHPLGQATYLLDRNINYTNVCRVGCDFCAFYRREGDAQAYVLTNQAIHSKIAEAIAAGGTGILMQGGVNPKLKIDYFEDLFRSIKERFAIHLHALSVIEIEGIAKVSRLSLDETLVRLKAAGLDSIPGAGAEILVDEIRLSQSPVKRHSHRWIDVMKTAHRHDLPTTATMMFGALEQPRHIIEHIARIRAAQDETAGFYAFIMWTFQGENTELLRENPSLSSASAVDYLKVLAVSRLMMDNIRNIQGSWVTMGPKVGQAALHFGANDMGSIMMEENVVSAAGTSHQLNQQSVVDLIHRAGFAAVQRDTYYNELARSPV